MAITQTRATVSRDEDGELRYWWGNLTAIRLTGEQTSGALAIIDLTLEPERMVPLHVHHKEDETFHMIEGTMTFMIGDETIEASAGDILVGPRDVPHRFKAGPDGARVLLLVAPANLEGLVREQSFPASARVPMPSGGPPPDLEKAREIALRYGCELLA